MYLVILIMLLLGENMLHGIPFDNDKINNFIHKIAKEKPISKNYSDFINQGKKVAHTILHCSSHPASVDRTEYLHTIIGLVWYLYAIAIQKGQGFTSGVMVIEDPDQKIYNFLYEYVRHVNPKKRWCRSLISLNPYGYSRQSTHFMHDQKKFIQYGIDMRFLPHQKAQRLLPACKTHLLFGRLSHGLTFIKFERYGLYFKDGFVGHAAGFLRHVSGRVLSHFIGQNEKELHRKEYIPRWIKKACKGLSLNHCGSPTSIKNILAASYKDNRFKSIVARIAEKYDHLEMRHGGEVIVSRKEMEDFSLQP